MRNILNKLDKLVSLLFEFFIYYMFFVLGYVAIILGFAWKPLGIGGIIIGVLYLILSKLKEKNLKEI